MRQPHLANDQENISSDWTVEDQRLGLCKFEMPHEIAVVACEFMRAKLVSAQWNIPEHGDDQDDAYEACTSCGAAQRLPCGCSNLQCAAHC